jgi:hypothetical protein
MPVSTTSRTARHVVAEAPERGQALLLGGQRDLQVMARHRLVERERHHLAARSRLGAVQVDEVMILHTR